MIRYCITDRRQANPLTTARHAVTMGAEMIQVREKDLSGRELFDLVCAVRHIAHGSATRVLVNDRLDIALAARTDGVHLPSNGLPAAYVRPHVALLGVSVHSIEEARAAETAGSDFIVFGPVFDTPGKTAVGIEALRQVAVSVRIPVLAIGGVTFENAPRVMAAGAAGIAGIRLFRPQGVS